MNLQKHQEILQEVLDEIQSAQNDPKGLLPHQRRLALMLSLGMCELIEIYFHKLGVFKEGSRIKHDWFRQKRVKEKLEQQIITSINTIKPIDQVIALAVEIEKGRDELAYGTSSTKVPLDTKIKQFFELKFIIENEVGALYGTK